MAQAQPHTPVMIHEVMAALKPVSGEVYVDGTFGAGGYAAAFLDAADCTVIAIDRDETAQAHARALQEKFGKRLVFLPGCFGDVSNLVRGAGYEKVDGFVLDLGVSSMQLDEAERGFSFRFDGPLDMRMGRADGGETAADVVNGYKEQDLADIIWRYGEERHSRRVARAIMKARQKAPIMRTLQLAEIVRGAVPKSPKDKIDPATRTFQALRIFVNRELEELQRALESAEGILKSGGRLVIVSFHSLEDGIVKHFLQERIGRKGRGSRHLPGSMQEREMPSTFSLLTKSSKPVFPSEAEMDVNPRARSARMRAAVCLAERKAS